MIDIVFPLVGEPGAIAEDYALLLARAVAAHLPWWADEATAGILPLAGLAQGAGVRYVGRHSRLILRLPQRRITSADFLRGAVFDLGGRVELGQGATRAIAPARVIHAAGVDMATDDEIEFMARIEAALAAGGMRAGVVCGRPQTLQGESGEIHAFRLMLAGLSSAQTLELQYRGLGHSRTLGCGHFVPHKNIAAVGSE